MAKSKITGICIFLFLSQAFTQSMYLGSQEDSHFIIVSYSFVSGSIILAPWVGTSHEGGIDVAASWYYTLYDDAFAYNYGRSISVKFGFYPMKQIEDKLFGLSLTIAGTQQHIEEPSVIDRNAYHAGAGLYKRLDLSRYAALIPDVRYAISNRSFLMEAEPDHDHYHTLSFSLPMLFYIKYLRRAFINPTYSWDGDDSSISVALCYLFIY